MYMSGPGKFCRQGNSLEGGFVQIRTLRGSKKVDHESSTSEGVGPSARRKRERRAGRRQNFGRFARWGGIGFRPNVEDRGVNVRGGPRVEREVVVEIESEVEAVVGDGRGSGEKKKWKKKYGSPRPQVVDIRRHILPGIPIALQLAQHVPAIPRPSQAARHLIVRGSGRQSAVRVAGSASHERCMMRTAPFARVQRAEQSDVVSEGGSRRSQSIADLEVHSPAEVEGQGDGGEGDEDAQMNKNGPMLRPRTCNTAPRGEVGCEQSSVRRRTSSPAVASSSKTPAERPLGFAQRNAGVRFAWIQPVFLRRFFAEERPAPGIDVIIIGDLATF
ncbi:hypothetical protein K438DRAFT_1764431 [Mycena galopus ATCC 62051]|nr:hypothetical protein K438DRAFT_1764431 [Mycena galopus ATCC 62051]